MTATSLLAALASAGAMYFVAARMFASASYGLLTAGLFAATPLLWRLGQATPASLYPLPFVLGWLLAVAHSRNARGPWWAVAAGVCLGAGVYVSNAAAVMMPVYLVLTIAILGHARSVARNDLGVCAAAFAVAAAPFAVWLVSHPDEFRNTIMAHHLYDADRFTVLQGAREMSSWVGLTARSEVYWDYLNPAFLFLTGGVLLPPLVFLLPAGVLRILAHESTPFARLSLAGLLTAPVAASLTAEAPTPARILFILPFAALVSTYGIEYVIALWQRPRQAADKPDQGRR